MSILNHSVLRIINHDDRIKSLNEKATLDRGEELKRKALERKEAPKKQKTVRDFSKVEDQINFQF